MKKQQQHTPGPWAYIVPDGHAVRHPQIYSDFGPVANATWLGENKLDQLKSNARLIASSPDLLEALRMWLDIHETPAGFAGKYGKAFDDALAAQQLKVDAAASAARAAIAKAVREAKE